MDSRIAAGFDVIVIFSFLFGLLVLSTAIFSSQVHRQPPWYGFLAPLFVYDIVLMLGMGFQNEAGPPVGFCIFQAVLLYSIPGWAVVAFGCFIIYFYLKVKNHIVAEDDGSEEPVLSGVTRRLLIFLPLLSFALFLLLNGLTTLLSKERPTATPNRYKLYCIPKTHVGLYVGGAIMVVAMVIWIFIIMRLGVLFRTHYSRLNGRGDDIFSELLSVYIRVTAISVAGTIVICLYVSTYATRNADSVLGSYFLGLPSIIIFLAFATQQDILRSWAFWYHTQKDSTKNQTCSTSSFGTQTHSRISMRPGNFRNIGYNWN